ncbi:MAG TPA: hypothetical protein VES20_25570, partial [Bryobacteraceae bacterium]|nr:hypothetical protein [Bryobacteraceae bacterium]
EFYDETRLQEIRDKWNCSECSDTWRPGCIVLDTDGEIATIARRDRLGRAELRYVGTPAEPHPTHVSHLHELISLRELARREKMSRYKVVRLLAAVGIEPAHKQGKTFYFDSAKAHHALQGRVENERSAVTLATLSTRTGVSEAVLARKIRAGHIQTLGHKSTHQIPAAEAQRIERVVRAVSLERTGICQTHARGRGGSEVANWNLGRLIEVTQAVSLDRRTIVFGQVAWRCEGTGQKRLHEVLDAYICSLALNPERAEVRRRAQLLLGLIHSLPAEFSRYRLRLSLLASGAIETSASVDDRVRQLASAAGCDSGRSYQKFRAKIDQGLSSIFSPRDGNAYACKPHRDDDYTEGAVVVTCSGTTPDVGVIMRVEQECWDCVSRAWHKTMSVRFAGGERRLSACTQLHTSENRQRVLVVLKTSEVIRVTEFMRQHGSSADVRQGSEHWNERRAS